MENNENNVEPKTISPEEIGKVVGGTTVEVNTQPVEAQPVEAQPVEVPVNPPVSTPEEKKVEEPKKEKKKGKKGILILVCVLLIAVGVCCYFVFFNKPKEKAIKTETKEVLSDYRITGNDLQAFDLYFLQLENEAKNKVYSPLSIKYALEMLSEGARGDTKKQIDAIIGEYAARSYPNSEHMSFANAMFIRDTFTKAVKEEYTNTLKEKYNAEVITDPFSGPDNVNNWVSNKTFKLINNLVDDVSNTNFILINALAIDMNWNNRIQAANAELPEGMGQMRYTVNYIHEKYSDHLPAIEDRYPSMKFNDDDNIKSVQVAASFNHYDIIKDKGEENIRSTIKADYEKYLQEHPELVEVCPGVDEYLNKYIKDIGSNYKRADISTDFYISDNETEKVFAKDLQTYDGVTLQYIGIMPKKEELTEYIKTVNPKSLSKMISDMKEVKYESFKEGVITKIKGNIPLFKYEYELKLLEDLKKLGIEDVFDISKSDLSNMLSGEKQYIEKAMHKANIEFSNDGIKAAAATAMGGTGSTGACGYDYEYEVPVEEIDVTFDKPFLYIIRDKDTGEVWFTGTVYEPIKNS